MLLHTYQVFSSLVGDLHFFVHFFINFMEYFFLGHPIVQVHMHDTGRRKKCAINAIEVAQLGKKEEKCQRWDRSCLRKLVTRGKKKEMCCRWGKNCSGALMSGEGGK